jgi:transposase-like protein
MGRLSNPPGTLETLAGQGIAGSGETREKPSNQAKDAPNPSGTDDREETGRLSNPSTHSIGMRPTARASTTAEQPRPSRTQKRLLRVEVDELIAAYKAGDGVEELAERFGVHRTTVRAHLDRRKIERRTVPTAWDHDDLTAAEAIYASGESLASVAARFGVDPSTIANRFRRAGVPVRPRRGWV